MSEPVHNIPILTTYAPPPGTEIEKILGPCWGVTVRSRSFVGTACAGCQTIFGGEIQMSAKRFASNPALTKSAANTRALLTFAPFRLRTVLPGMR